MVPNEAYEYLGIVQLFQHFRWTWVGLLAASDENGDRFLQTALPVLSQNGICDAFIVRMPKRTYLGEFLDMAITIQEKYPVLAESKANVFFAHGESSSMVVLRLLLLAFDGLALPPLCKVWIVTSHWDCTTTDMQRTWDIQTFHGALSFTIHSNEPLGFLDFVQSIKPFWTKKDGFIKDFWEQSFDCSFEESCTGDEELGSLSQTLYEMSMTGRSYCIYSAVHAVAHALHHVSKSRPQHRKLLEPLNVEPWQVISQPR